MSQREKLQAIIDELRASEAKMNEGDHISFGMSCMFLFIFPMWALINGEIWYFVGSMSCLGLAIPSYYLISTFRDRGSWYWEKVSRGFAGKDLHEMWTASERGDWLLSFAAHMIGKNGWPTHQQVVRAACQCGRLAIPHFKPGEMRPIIAIETAEAWARGEATIEQVEIAGRAAKYMEHDDDTAYCAASAASDAAWAVYATEDGAGFRLAQAAGGAATWASWAAGSATNEFGKLRDDARAAVLKECANIARCMLKIPNELTNELPLYSWIRRWDTNSRSQPTGRMRHIPISVSRCNPAYVLKGDELDNQTINPVLRATSTLLVCAAAWVLIGALNKNPIQYYTMLRWLTCSTAVVLVWRGVIQGSCKWAYLLVPIAIIFNPIVPIHLQGNRLAILRTWQTLDVVAAVAMVLTLTLMELQVVLAKKRRLR